MNINVLGSFVTRSDRRGHGSVVERPLCIHEALSALTGVFGGRILTLHAEGPGFDHPCLHDLIFAPIDEQRLNPPAFGFIVGKN